MYRILVAVAFLLLASEVTFANLKLHFQSPFREDSTTSGFIPHVFGADSASGPVLGDSSATRMKGESAFWFTYTFGTDKADSLGDSASFSITMCPDADSADVSECKPWNTDISVGDIFASGDEAWIYTDAGKDTYSVKYSTHDGKYVWFKSPWGNKAVPMMHFGADSVLMHFVLQDSSACGWFYGVLTEEMLSNNVLQDVYFVRYKAPWLSFPAAESSTVDITEMLKEVDDVYIDGTSSKVSAEKKMGKAGECFDPSLRIHVFNPWRTNGSYRDTAVYLQVDGIVEMQDSLAMDVVNRIDAKDTAARQKRLEDYIQTNRNIQLKKDGEPRFWSYRDFPDSIVNSEAWKSSAAYVQIYRSSSADALDRAVKYFSDDYRPLVSSLFPEGIYEVWLNASTNLNVLDVFYYPPEPKVVRFLTPWNRIPTSMLVMDLGDTVKMGPFSSDTCGWFEASYYKHVSSWGVYFKQSFGLDYYSMDGIDAYGKTLGEEIILDSVFKDHDTVWVYPYPVYNASPKISTEFPGRLGQCPSMTISAMLLDWAGESFDDSLDIDFGNLGGNAYTLKMVGDDTVAFACQPGGALTGMVKDTLILRDSLIGMVPERVDSALYPWAKCAAANEMDKWFVPQVVAKDASGKEYTNATCRDINLDLDDEGFWQADFTNERDCNDPLNPGFFPLDDFKFLDDAGLVPNPKYDTTADGWMKTDEGWREVTCHHNYSFTMKIAANFKYVKGQYFEFRGDDDVWVYINNKLVVDLGGVHEPTEGAVNLDTLNLVEGEEYPFNVFFSERNAIGSNFRMRTSINLKTESNYFPVWVPSDTLIQVNLKQYDVSLSQRCDASVTAYRDTLIAPSRFLLKSLGGDERISPEGQWLVRGVNYGGITIGDDLSSFVIDTNMIVRLRSLSSGPYVLQTFLESDETQSHDFYFIVPDYPKPTIAFVDSLGQIIPGDTLRAGIGKFVHVPTAVRVAVLYFGEICTDCYSMLGLHTSDSLLFLDDYMKVINLVESDSLGYAAFNVIGIGTVVDGQFTIGSEYVQNVLVWEGINLEWPKHPLVSEAEMYDRDGDGFADSLIVVFNEKFGKKKLNYTDWMFGDSSVWHSTVGFDNVQNFLKDSKKYVEVGDAFTKDVFTGLDSGIYQGLFKYHYRYYDEDAKDTLESDTLRFPVKEKIGAILERGVLSIKSKTVRSLKLHISEATVPDSVENLAKAFQFRVWRKGSEVSKKLKITKVVSRKDESLYELYFMDEGENVLPSVGDSVRLTPKVLPDLSGNTPHKNNPWVRIIGDQDLAMEVTKVVLVDPGEILKKKVMRDGKVVNVAEPHVVPIEWTVDDIVEEFGLPGQVLSFDMREMGITARDTGLSLDSVRIVWDVYYFTNIGQYVNHHKGSLACSDDLYGGDCTKNTGKVFLAWNCVSEQGRVVGTGAYVAKVEWGVYVGPQKVGTKSKTYLMGVRHGKNE